MAEAPILHNELIEDNVFGPTIEQCEILTGKINGVISAFQSMASVTGKKINSSSDPKTLNELQEQINLNERLIALEGGKTEAIKLRAKVQVLSNQASQQARAEAKAELSAYASLQLQYSKTAKQAKDLAAQYGINDFRAKTAAASAQVYGDKLKAIDASVGQYQRHVGDYANQIGLLGKSLRGFGGLGIILSNALGIDPLLAEGIRESGKAFIDLKHAEDISKISGEEKQAVDSAGIVLTKEQIAAQEEYLAAMETTIPVQEANIAATDGQTVALEENAAATVQVGFIQRLWNIIIGESTTAMRVFSLTLLTTGIGALILLIGYVVGHWEELTGALGRATRAQRLLNEVNEKAIDNYATEADSLNNLVAAAQDTNLSYQARLDSLNKAKEAYPGYLRFINLENINSAAAAESVKKLTEALLAQSNIKAGGEALDEQSKKVLQLKQSFNEIDTQKPFFQTAFATLKAGIQGFGSVSSLYTANEKEATEATKTLTDYILKQKEALDKLGGATDSDALEKTLNKLKLGFETTNEETKKNTLKQFATRKAVIDEQYLIDQNDLKKSEEEKKLITAKYNKEIEQLGQDAGIFQLQNAKAIADASVLFTTKGSQAELNAKVEANKAQEALDVAQAIREEKSQDQINLIHKKALKDRTVLLLDFQAFKKSLREQDAEVNTSIIANDTDREIEQEKLSLQKKLEAIIGFSDEENKLREDLIKASQKKLDDLTQQKDDQGGVDAAGIKASQARKNSEDEFSAKIALLEAEKQKEIDIAIQKGEDLKVINEKYRKQEEDAIHEHNLQLHQDAIDQANAEIIELQVHHASAQKIRDREKSLAREERDKAISEAEGDKAKIALAQANYDKAISDIDKKTTDEEIQRIQTVTDAYFQSLDNRLSYSKQVNDQKLTEIDKEIQQQTTLQVAGQKNMLAFLEKQRADAIVKQAALDKQAKEQKEAQQLASLFLEFMKVNADKGIAAAAISLSETLAAKAIAGGFSGSFFDGTEDTGPGGDVDGRGGMLAVLHPHEGVATRAANEANPGLIGAMNRGEVDNWVMENIYPKVPVQNDMSRKEETIIAANKMLGEKIDKLTEVMKNKKEIAFGKTVEGDLYVSETENGKQAIAIKKPPITSPRQTYFKR